MSPIDRYREILEQSGRRMTRERRAIAETALEFLRAFSIDELLQELKNKGYDASRSAVYRTLQHLVQPAFCAGSRGSTPTCLSRGASPGNNWTLISRMTESLARLDIASEIARLTLSRPQKRNALTREFLNELDAAITAVEDAPGLRVLTLEAEGPVFCAGMDLGEMEQRATHPDSAAEWKKDTEVYRRVVERLFATPRPTVAVVQGPVLAGGLGLVLACDVVLAAESATFSLPEPRRGITAAVVTPLLNYRLGPGNSGYLLLSGSGFSSADALRVGLCHAVAADGDLEERRQELVASILTGAPSALAISKRTLQDCAGASLAEQLDRAMATSAEARETADAREGLAAFLERRKPSWSPE